MNVVIAGHFHFPHGGAPAARIRNLALGFEESGANVHVIAMAPPPERTARSRLPGNPSVTYENVALFAAGRSADAGLLRTSIRRARWFAGMYGAAFPAQRRVSQLIRDGLCDLFIGYGRNAALLAPLVRICRRHHIPTVLDITEIPEQFSGLGGVLSPVYWDWRLGTQWLPQQFDVLSVITCGLQERYARLGCSRVLVIPSIEGWSDLPTVNLLAARDRFRLVYVGALLARDAPDLLFAALRLLHQQDVPVELDVIGRYATNAQGRAMMELVQADPVLRTLVRFVGAVSDDELVEHLRTADGLILMRRDAPTEVNAFPTRLVEYLKQGRPVFVSDVGDIRRYLRHAVDAMLLSPVDATQVAAAIRRVAALDDRGYALGVQGQARGAEMFDRRVHVQRLLDFMRAQQLVPA